MNNYQLTEGQIASYSRHLRLDEKSPGTVQKYLRDIRAFVMWLDHWPANKELSASWKSYCERMKLDRLLEQWDTASNLPLTPEQISYGSNRKVWWQCEKGHDYRRCCPFTWTASPTLHIDLADEKR